MLNELVALFKDEKKKISITKTLSSANSFKVRKTTQRKAITNFKWKIQIKN